MASAIGKIVGLGIAGFGVYWAGSTFGWWGGTAAAPAAPPGSTVPAAAPSVPAPAVALTTDQQGSLIAALKTAACASDTACTDPVLSGSEWNWYMNNKTNPGSTPAQLPTGDSTMDAAGYVAARVAAGFGLGAYRSNPTVPRNYVRKLRRFA